jgi:peptide deformylase
MLLKILQAGDPLLRRPAQPVSPDDVGRRDLQRLIDLMQATMRDAGGVGLAAPQTGESLRIAVVEVLPEYLTGRGYSEREIAEREMQPLPFQVLVNPRLTVMDATRDTFFEGCLSVTGFAGAVPRALGVRVSALDRHGEPIEITARGWHARILQHETDHLDGRLYVDIMDPLTFSSRENHDRYWRPKP